MSISVSRIIALGTAALGLAVAGSVVAAPAHADPGVTPTHYADALAPGASATLTKTVTTPVIPPNPDIVLMADTTGSMTSSIANVRTNASAILAQVKAAQPTAQFAVAEYKDAANPATAYKVNQQLTASDPDVVAGINQWSASGGGDEAEDWIGALGKTPSSIAFRPDGSRVVVMFGDAPSHDPSLGFTQASAIAALQAAGIRVIAISVPNSSGGGGLGPQATAVTTATGGSLANANPSQISAVILEELQNLPAVVTHTSTCDDGVSVSLTPATQTVTSGGSVTFTETVTLAGDAPQGGTVGCEVQFLVNGTLPGPEFVQTVDIDVLDVTPPSAACVAGPNPGGHVPAAGSNPRSGQNPDGFYVLTASDNVDAAPQVFVRDTGSGHVFGPFADGQRIKYTQARSGPSQKTMDGGILKLVGTGDAETWATDASGNGSVPVACLVPSPPK